MFSWGEFVIITGVSIAFIGRKDLPKVAYVTGQQIGRFVGFLQGARARADRFAAQSELRQLQNELRSGLRELDAVKSELAISMSPSAMIGRTLGPMTPNANNLSNLTSSSSFSSSSAMGQQQWHSQQLLSTNNPINNNTMINSTMNTGSESAKEPLQNEASCDGSGPGSEQYVPTQSSVAQSSLAVAEQVWQNQGIGFASVAERGVGLSLSNTGYNREQAGSVVLAKILQESLIFDQYDRIVAEQNATLQSKVSSIQEKYEASKKAAQDVQSDKNAVTMEGAQNNNKT